MSSVSQIVKQLNATLDQIEKSIKKNHTTSRAGREVEQIDSKLLLKLNSQLHDGTDLLESEMLEKKDVKVLNESEKRVTSLMQNVSSFFKDIEQDEDNQQTVKVIATILQDLQKEIKSFKTQIRKAEIKVTRKDMDMNAGR